MVLGGKSRHKGIEIKGAKILNNYFSVKYALNLAGHYYDFTNQDIGVASGNEIRYQSKSFWQYFYKFSML